MQLCVLFHEFLVPLFSQILIFTISDNAGRASTSVWYQIISTDKLETFSPFFNLLRKKEERDKKIVAVLYGALFNNNTAIDLFIAFEWYIKGYSLGLVENTNSLSPVHAKLVQLSHKHKCFICQFNLQTREWTLSVSAFLVKGYSNTLIVWLKWIFRHLNVWTQG